MSDAVNICTAAMPSGEECGQADCRLHALVKPSYYDTDIWRAVIAAKEAGQLDSMEADITAIRVLHNIVRDDPTLDNRDRYALMLACNEKAAQLVARQDKMLHERQFMIHRDLLMLALDKFYEAVKDNVTSQAERAAVGRAIKQLNVELFKAKRLAS